MDIISVVVPAYNAEGFVADAIKSLLTQTAPNWELIVVDDGSTDKTFEVLKKYAAQDARIKVFTQKNAGPAAARRRGVEQSAGEWIAFLDADDCLEREAIETFNKKVCSGTSDIYIFSHHQGWNYRPLTIGCEAYRKAALCQEFNTGPWCKLFRKRLLVGGVLNQPKGMNCGEDWLMNIRIAFQLNGTATFCKETVYHYRDINPQSLMKSFKSSWAYTNKYYEELVNSIPRHSIDQYAADLVVILSAAYHSHWRKRWRISNEAHTSYIYQNLLSISEKYDIRPPLNEWIEEQTTIPIVRFFLDMAERCYGTLKRLLSQHKCHKYYDD